ncbi:peptidase M24 [Psychromonas sp. CNPT3]|uniref:Xaa-Pro aminopeptidase n=1 Tax=Psychromonas sp. CNPT3 TaxID=314282 RepID=UPI00006E78E6|nr:Xaa-Pro aminopeptidase [Psychromonas sp. CNPT3]AGH82083.1 peptidase M24 [Psychromonas sp. CNPT3]
MQQFNKRREQFFDKMLMNSMAIFASATEKTRNNDCEYPFRQESSFLYLSGFNEPDAYIVLLKSEQGNKSILFNRKKDKSAEIWHGYRVGQKAALSDFHFDDAYIVDDFETQLTSMMNGVKAIYYPIFQAPKLEKCLAGVINQLRAGSRKGKVAPTQFFDNLTIIHEMRLLKSEHELSLLAEAGDISAAGHVHAMKVCKVGMWEYQLEAEIKCEFARQGTREIAYNSIVAGGNNACCLHYSENNQQLKDGDLVLIDAGAEYQGYAGDITRTFPVNGVFSPAQAKLYQLVLDVQTNAISLIKPGIALLDINKQVIQQMVEGLVALGLMRGDVQTLIKNDAIKDFYMHGIGHYIGLDVHDVGDYGSLENPRVLEAGMVITIEPGIYVSMDADVDKYWQGIGIRIEDDIVVTETGAQVLTAGVPKSIEDIEAIMAN